MTEPTPTDNHAPIPESLLPREEALVDRVMEQHPALTRDDAIEALKAAGGI